MTEPATPTSRPRTILVRTLATLLPVALVLLAIPIWHYSDLIVGPHQPSTFHEQRVFTADSGSVRLSRDRESLQSGTWTLQWEDGFGRIGAVLASDDTSVVRAFEPVLGKPPVGGWASLRGISRSANPMNMLGIAYDAKAFDGPLGTYPAWFVPGSDSTWVIYVHGIGANRAEGLRTFSVLTARGLPALFITYRNDLDAPSSPDGLYHLGLTEWQDIEAAVRYALAHGARRVLISSYSMGGQITLQFMSRSPLARRVAGLVLESPAMDWNATLVHRSRVLHVPGIATWLGKQLAGMRAGLDWEQLDRVNHHEGLTVPILLFHGIHDQYVPESPSEAFARALPGQVTFVPVEEANHVEAWNADPARYTARLHEWCTAHGIGATPR